MSQDVFINKVHLQYFDAVEDAQQEYWYFAPIGVLNHKITSTITRTIDPTDSTIKLKRKEMLE